MNLAMVKPYVCILVEAPQHISPAGFEVAVAKSIGEAKVFFRTLPIACLVVPLRFKGTNIIAFLSWFRKHFPKVLIIILGKRFAADDIKWQIDSSVVFLPSGDLDHVLVAVEPPLHERGFTFNFEIVRSGKNCYSSPWPQKVLRYLLENNRFLHVASVQALADHFGITEPYLLKNLNPHLPITLKKFLLVSKLCYAAWLKDMTTLTIKTIAPECGFSDASHLGHVACKYLDMPLSSFLRSHSWHDVLPQGIDKFQQKNDAEKN